MSEPASTRPDLSFAPVIDVRDLRVTFATPDGPVEAVKGVSFHIAPGECVGVVGESGSGKSQTFLAAFGLLPDNARTSGSVAFCGREILGLPRRQLNHLRGRRMTMVFQDPLTSLTPHLRIGEQMGEVLRRHFGKSPQAARTQCLDWLERVRIPEAARRLDQYPHELSGGMRQRVMLAMAMMTEPELLIADEPTTALDATVQAQVLDIIKDLMGEMRTAVALVTHDMGVIARMAERVIVMRHGEIVEQNSAEQVFAAPVAAYTRTLLESMPRLDASDQHSEEESLGPTPPEDTPALLTVLNLKVHFPVRTDTGKRLLRAVDGVDFNLLQGETIGIVGESGCGKSTLARAVLNLLPLSAGSVAYLSRALPDVDRREMRAMRRDLQIVFQDPLASLDPRMTVGDSISEPLRVHEPALTRDGRDVRAREMMVRVGLDADLVNRYPHELSGGQNQRVGIARAMILKPKLVVCDEAVSALDVSIQAQIVRLLIKLQKQFGMSMLFISHDLAVVREISHRVMVLYLGRIVEFGPANAIYDDARHPYTRALLAAAPAPDPASARARPRLTLGDLPSPLDPRASLQFLKSRLSDAPGAEPYRPKLLEVGPRHYVAEHDPY